MFQKVNENIGEKIEYFLHSTLFVVEQFLKIFDDNVCFLWVEEGRVLPFARVLADHGLEQTGNPLFGSSSHSRQESVNIGLPDGIS